MNETHDAKTAVIKTLAIVGFLAIALALIWTLVQGVRFVPGAFASLASIAESIQNYRPITELSVATEKSIVNSNESFQLNWTDMKRHGTYHFSYTCTEGVSLNVRGGDGDLVTIPCTEKLSLPEDVHGLFVSIESEKSRFSDVAFSVAFETENGETLVERTGKITVVNATIPAVAENIPETPAVVEKPVSKPVTKPTQVAAPIVATPVVTHTEVSYIPQSYTNGFTDLSTTFLGVGTMHGNVFTPSANYDRSERGGLKFEVKNIGTKTSDTWTFTATLPSGVTYTSDKQVALKPNEKVVFTLGFTMDESDKAKTTTLKVDTDVKNDTNSKNDSFSWSVKVVN
jgi:hypothetical protein